ncbi:MAG: YbaK/EbsC family protein [Anaerolineae bacterium]|jgi:prolyl-tRNA editing enzyme YbaK/EbsC (Cys-tRNA(Pro) deacylase)|nr:MAG: YbaK/EbsC family protein [Anaerolineae bacterium]
MQPLTPEDVQAALDAQNTGIQIQYFEQSTATSEEAAAAANTALGSIVKSIVFIADTQPVLVLTSGDQRIDDRKIASHYNIGRKKVRIATADECITIVGYAPGGVPPLGHRTPNLPIFIDRMLSRYDRVYAAAGAPNAIFPIPYQQLIEITGGTVMDVVKDS